MNPIEQSLRIFCIIFSDFLSFICSSINCSVGKFSSSHLIKDLKFESFSWWFHSDTLSNIIKRLVGFVNISFKGGCSRISYSFVHFSNLRIFYNNVFVYLLFYFVFVYRNSVFFFFLKNLVCTWGDLFPFTALQYLILSSKVLEVE